MKTLITTLLLAAIALPLAACETSQTTSAKRNIDGSTTYNTTTVHQNDLTGTTTVDQNKVRVR